MKEGTDVFMDGIDIDHQRFYEMLVERDELPKTGQVNPYAFSQAIAEVSTVLPEGPKQRQSYQKLWQWKYRQPLRM